MLRHTEVAFRATIDSPRGPAHVLTTEIGVCALALPGVEPGRLDRWFAATLPGATLTEGYESDPHIQQARTRLAGYFSGQRTFAELPLDLRGTPFQRAVWREVTRTPFGSTRPFAEVAAAIAEAATARAVGSAILANPLAIFVPTHRVVDQDGHVAGKGATASIHRWLLAHEGLMPEADEVPARWYRKVQTGAGPVYIGTPRARTYCLPACINVQEEVAWVPRIFQTTQQARAAGFRPCPTCRPDAVIRNGSFPA